MATETLLNGPVEAEDRDEGRKMDPEIRLMGQILRDLREIEPEARARVVRWLSSRCEHDATINETLERR